MYYRARMANRTATGSSTARRSTPPTPTTWLRCSGRPRMKPSGTAGDSPRRPSGTSRTRSAATPSSLRSGPRCSSSPSPSSFSWSSRSPGSSFTTSRDSGNNSYCSGEPILLAQQPKTTPHSRSGTSTPRTGWNGGCAARRSARSPSSRRPS